MNPSYEKCWTSSNQLLKKPLTKLFSTLHKHQFSGMIFHIFLWNLSSEF